MSSMAGMRVIELGGSGPQATAVAYAGKLFAGFGAEVLRLDTQEIPIDARQAWLHTGKASASFAAADRSEIERLVGQADFIFDGLGVGGLEKIGLAPEVLKMLNPRAILVRVSSFGLTGPYRDFEAEEITLYAMSGLMHCTGDGTKAPLNAGPEVCGFSAGMKAYVAGLMAWLRRERSGAGDTVELSVHETALDNFEIAISEYLNTGKVARRNNDEHAMVPWRAFPCLDGYATIIGGPIRNWRKGAALFEAPELLGPDFAHMGDRIRNRARFREVIAPWLMRTDKRSIYHAGQKAGLAWSYVATLGDAFESPQNAARKFFVPIEQPGLGECRMPDAPFLGTQLKWQTRPAPQPGANDSELAKLWTARAAVDSTKETTADRQPLAGLKVIDFTHDWAGPHAARLLADYGADVIKVEHSDCMDGMRGAFVDKIETYPRFWQLHRGKKSITLDLKRPEHLACCKALIAESDVVVENSRPGVMDRLGLGYDVLKTLNPKIVMCSLSAFGATGPESSYAGYGGSIEALSGLQSMTAYEPQGPFIRIREMDVLNGVMGDCAMLTALAQLQRTGEGQWLDISESEACTWMLGEKIIEYSQGGKQTPPLGNRDAHQVQGAYACAGEDRWIVLSLRDDAEWQRFATTIGQPELAGDARFTTAELRRRNQDEIDALISVWTKTRDSVDVMQTLQAARLACGMVMTVKDLEIDPHLAARNWFINAENGRFPGFPYRFEAGGGEFRGRGPTLGAGNEEVLARLGLPRESWCDLSRDKLGTAYDEPADEATAGH